MSDNGRVRTYNISKKDKRDKKSAKIIIQVYKTSLDTLAILTDLRKS